MANDRGRPLNLTTILRKAARECGDMKDTDQENCLNLARRLEEAGQRTFVDVLMLLPDEGDDGK